MVEVKLNNSDWQYLGLFYDENKAIIEIGDSIAKHSDSFNIYLIKAENRIIDCTSNRFLDRSCN